MLPLSFLPKCSFHNSCWPSSLIQLSFTPLLSFHTTTDLLSTVLYSFTLFSTPATLTSLLKFSHYPSPLKLPSTSSLSYWSTLLLLSFWPHFLITPAVLYTSAYIPLVDIFLITPVVFTSTTSLHDLATLLLPLLFTLAPSFHIHFWLPLPLLKSYFCNSYPFCHIFPSLSPSHSYTFLFSFTFFFHFLSPFNPHPFFLAPDHFVFYSMAQYFMYKSHRPLTEVYSH